jgi:predicted RNA-binding protein YlqC (UPF0109 family)
MVLLLLHIIIRHLIDHPHEVIVHHERLLETISLSHEATSHILVLSIVQPKHSIGKHYHQLVPDRVKLSQPQFKSNEQSELLL